MINDRGIFERGNFWMGILPSAALEEDGTNVLGNAYSK